MLYKNYKNRLEKIAKIIDFIKKHRTLILSCIGVLLALSIAFVAVRGTITSPINISSTEIVYGEQISCEADALFRKVDFEYKKDGESEWVGGYPEKAGAYLVRGYALNSFGSKNYTDEKAVIIKPKPIDLKPATSVITYGEVPKVVGSLINGDSVDQESVLLNFEKTVGNVSFTVESDSVKILNKNGEDVTYCYEIITPETTVVVNKKHVTLKVDGAEKTYDGTPLTCDKYQIDELSFEDKFEISFSSSQTNFGSIKNTPKYKILSSDGSDVTANYIITEDIGSLSVLKRPITVKVKDKEAVYNAVMQTCDDYEIVLGELVEGQTVSKCTYKGGRTNVGSDEVEFTSLSIQDLSKKDVSKNYEITYEKGEIKIVEREITVNVSGSKTYDDTALILISSQTGIQVISNSKYDLIEGHELTVYTTSNDAGEYDENGVEYKIKKDYHDLTSNYKVVFDSISITIDKRTVTLTANSNSKVYNATPLVCSGYTIDNLLPGHVETATVNGEITDVGSVASTVSCNLIKRGEDDVTKNYAINCVDGTLFITKRSVKVFANVDKIYDDTTNIPNGTLSLFVYKIEDDGSETEGLYDNQQVIAEFEILNGVKDADEYSEHVAMSNGSLSVQNGKLENYDILALKGNLIVRQREIVIQTATGSKVYNGYMQSCEQATVGGYGLVSWHDIKYKNWLSLVDVDEPVKNTVTVDKIYVSGDESDVKTYNYSITYDEGYFNITPRVIKGKITGEKTYDDWIFDGEFTNADIQGDISDDNKLVLNHYFSVQTNSSNASKYLLSQNQLVCKVYGDSGDASKNYDLSEFEVEITIDKKQITIKAPDDTKIYDSKNYSKEYNELMLTGVSNHVVGATVYGTYADVVDKNINFITIDRNSVKITRGVGGEDVAFNYEFTCEKGNLEITKRYVKVWADVKKTYDDTTNIPNGTLTLFVFKTENDGSETEGLYGNQILTAEFEILDGIKDAGTYNGKVAVIENSKSIENGKLSNYEIDFIKGKLVVEKRVIVIHTATGSKVYNGEYQTYEFATVEGQGLVSWHDIKYKNWLSLVDVDEPVKNTVTVDKIYVSGDESDVKTYNYSITYDEGYFNITPRVIKGKITGEKTYDDWIFYGEFTNADIQGDISDDNKLVLNHYFSVQTNSSNASKYLLSQNQLVCKVYGVSGDVSKNYDLSEFEVEITINKKQITIFAPNATKIYDGEIYCVEYNNTNQAGVSNHYLSFKVYGAYKSVKSGNYTYVDLTSVKVTRGIGGESVTSNYEFTCEKGNLEITKREIKVQANYKKTYDDTNVFTAEHQSGIIWIKNDDGIFEEYKFNGQNRKLYANQDLTVSAFVIGDFVDAGSYFDVVYSSCEITLEGSGEDLTEGGFKYIDNYDITVQYGIATIDKLKIKFKTEGKTQEYNRQPLTNNVIYALPGYSLISGHEIVVDELNLPSITEVGEINNDILFDIKKEGVSKKHNYEILQGDIGKLVVTKIELSVLIYNYKNTYNGNLHSFEQLEYVLTTPSKLLQGDAFTGLTDWLANGEAYSDNSVRDAGHYQITATAVFSYLESYTDYYNVSFIQGNVDILQSRITIVTKSITSKDKITNAMANNYELSGDGIGADDSLDVIITGKQEQKGNSSNTVSQIVINGDSYDIQGSNEYDLGNYLITIVEGKLNYI